ncbi:hypothetical protein BD626DRAFT_478777 [Schizophyllum amplum]|uniref:Uncharacterized protein n=1 Tax=Schizophyllum amplum TaxID=97359 RepID=A0A550CRL6_9AGAR|nr:hypothetical protein BD626DRAFT_478777 [Auriculariopsis ampla]
MARHPNFQYPLEPQLRAIYEHPYATGACRAFCKYAEIDRDHWDEYMYGRGSHIQGIAEPSCDSLQVPSILQDTPFIIRPPLCCGRDDCDICTPTLLVGGMFGSWTAPIGDPPSIQQPFPPTSILETPSSTVDSGCKADSNVHRPIAEANVPYPSLGVAKHVDALQQDGAVQPDDKVNDILLLQFDKFVRVMRWLEEVESTPELPVDNQPTIPAMKEEHEFDQELVNFAGYEGLYTLDSVDDASTERSNSDPGDESTNEDGATEAHPLDPEPEPFNMITRYPPRPMYFVLWQPSTPEPTLAVAGYPLC